MRRLFRVGTQLKLLQARRELQLKTGLIFLTRGADDPSRPTPDFWELTIKAG